VVFLPGVVACCRQVGYASNRTQTESLLRQERSETGKENLESRFRWRKIATGGFMSYDANLMFKCPKCTWWIAGTHISPEPLTKLQVDEQMFDLKCAEQDCDWLGQLAGREGSPAPTMK